MKSLAKDSNALSQETDWARAPESRRHRGLPIIKMLEYLKPCCKLSLEPLECPAWSPPTSTSATQPSDPPADLPTIQNDSLQTSAPT